MLQTLALTHQTNSITQTKKIIMKHSLRYSLLLLLSMVFSLSSQAQTLIDGIYYSLNRIHAINLKTIIGNQGSCRQSDIPQTYYTY